MEDLEAALMNAYGIKAGRIEAYMDGYMAVTPTGEVYIKKNNLSPERLMFIHGAKKHLAKNGFTGTDMYYTTLDGQVYMRLEKGLYTLTDRSSGRECDFYRLEDLLKCIETVAQMHRSSRGYLPPSGCTCRRSLGKLPGDYRKKLRELKRLRNYAQLRKTSFDRLYLEHVDMFYAHGENAIRKIDTKPYHRLVERAGKEKSFCHGNLTHRNILFERNSILLKGFEQCSYDIKVCDIVDFVRRRLRKCGWSVQEADMLINRYSESFRLEKDELEVIKGMLCFPYRFWKVSNRFYNNRRNWAVRTYTPKLKELAKDAGQIDEFVRTLYKVM